MERHERVPVADGELYVESRGGPGKPAVVFIHGFSLDARMWDAQWLALDGRFRMIRYDMRGYGRSSVPAGPYSPVEDLRALLDHAGIDRAALIGLSRGGSLALDFGLTHPERVDGLVLVDTVLGGWPWSVHLRALDEAVWALARRDGIEPAKRAWLAHPILAPAMARPEARAQVEAMVNDWSGWQFLNRDPAQHPKPPAAQRLRQLACRALVIVGEHDLPDFIAIADRIASDAPRAQQVVMPGIGHLPPIEAPDRFTQIVLEFLA